MNADPKYARAEDCPDAATRHTPCPTSYAGWQEWARKISKTHKQVRCPMCGYLSIWVERKAKR